MLQTQKTFGSSSPLSRTQYYSWTSKSTTWCDVAAAAVVVACPCAYQPFNFLSEGLRDERNATTDTLQRVAGRGRRPSPVSCMHGTVAVDDSGFLWCRLSADAASSCRLLFSRRPSAGRMIVWSRPRRARDVYIGRELISVKLLDDYFDVARSGPACGTVWLINASPSPWQQPPSAFMT